MKKETKCDHCVDKKTNYNCPCWFEGWLMGEAEYEFNHPEFKIKVKVDAKDSRTVILN